MTLSCPLRYLIIFKRQFLTTALKRKTLKTAYYIIIAGFN
ncbi:hypothetical protein FQV37_1295 [Psychrobacter nivimaris]|uniref:Uncharacterized protein n=1 Tax=Psychrobacter nivimaris TaxID=281738 RepID=A0A6N7BWV5_9GAMM|nr:hypothetical protein FQV37_1295 [Psychrobacter nivimaris]